MRSFGICEASFWQNYVVSGPRWSGYAQSFGSLPPELVICRLLKRHTSAGAVGGIGVSGNEDPLFCWDCPLDSRHAVGDEGFPMTRKIFCPSQSDRGISPSKDFKIQKCFVFESCWWIEPIVLPYELHKILWVWPRGVNTWSILDIWVDGCTRLRRRRLLRRYKRREVVEVPLWKACTYSESGLVLLTWDGCWRRSWYCCNKFRLRVSFQLNWSNQREHPVTLWLSSGRNLQLVGRRYTCRTLGRKRRQGAWLSELAARGVVRHEIRQMSLHKCCGSCSNVSTEMTAIRSTAVCGSPYLLYRGVFGAKVWRCRLTKPLCGIGIWSRCKTDPLGHSDRWSSYSWVTLRKLFSSKRRNLHEVLLWRLIQSGLSGEAGERFCWIRWGFWSPGLSPCVSDLGTLWWRLRIWRRDFHL